MLSIYAETRTQPSLPSQLASVTTSVSCPRPLEQTQQGHVNYMTRTLLPWASLWMAGSNMYLPQAINTSSPEILHATQTCTLSGCPKGDCSARLPGYSR